VIVNLAPLDWLIVLTYLLVSLGIGWFFRGIASHDLAEYFISGRKLPWWIAGTSMVATTFAADTPLAVTGLVIKYGVAGNWRWWALAMGGMITAFIYAPLWRRAEVMTDVELIELRYGGSPAKALRVVRAIYVGLLANSLIIGWVSGAMLVFMREVFFNGGDQGNSEITQWSLLIGLMVLVGVYSTASGMWGVAINDVMQFCVAMFGCIWLAVTAVKHVGGLEALQTKVSEQFPGGSESLRVLPSFAQDDSWLPLHVFLIMTLVQWWASWYPGAEPGGGGYVVQRVAACKNERHALGATVWFQLAHYCLRPWPWILVALSAMVIFPELRQQFIQDPEHARPDAGYPMVIREVAKPGLLGLMVVVFLAAYMSTLSTQINWGASYLVRDIYQRFISPSATQSELVRASRIASVLVLVFGAIATRLLESYSIDDVWNLLLALGSGTGAVFMLRWFWWRINAWSEISAMAASLVLFLLIGVEGTKHLPTQIWTVSSSDLRLLISAGGTIAIWLICTFVTPPEQNDILMSFYRKIRPAGPGWRRQSEATGLKSPDSLLGPLAAALCSSLFIYSTLDAIGAWFFGTLSHAVIASLLVVTFGVLTLTLIRTTQPASANP
jgi:solute:Na+ symporter, SSS family